MPAERYNRSANTKNFAATYANRTLALAPPGNAVSPVTLRHANGGRSVGF